MAYYDIDVGGNANALGGRVEIGWGTSTPGVYERQILTHTSAGARYITLADVNVDGHLDFFVVYELINTVACWFYFPGRIMKELIVYTNFLGPNFVRSTDIDGNGYPDAIVSYHDSELITILLNINGQASVLFETDFIFFAL